MANQLDPNEKVWQERLTRSGRDPLSVEFSAGGGWESYISDISLLQYPQNLGYDPKMQNYVLFEIYDTSGQALDTERNALNSGSSDGAFFGGKSASEIREEYGELATESAESVVGQRSFFGFGGESVGVKNFGAGVERGFEDLINLFNPNAAGGLNDQEVLNLAKSGRGNVSYNAARLGFANRTKKIGGPSIALPLPAQLNASYGFEYEEVDFTGLMNLIEAKDILVDGASNRDTSTRTYELAKKLGKIPSDLLDSVSEIFGSEGANIMDAISMKTRQASNQFKEQVFKGVGRRTFSFEWSLSPRSKEDVRRIYGIIYTFKKYSHPSRTDGGLFLNFPGEFKIGFFNKIDLNDYLFRIGMCACTKCEVTYGGDELMFFRDFENTVDPGQSKGAPANVMKLSLEFTELELLTRERIEQGY